MAEPTTLIREPLQERSRETLHRIFEAAERLMADRPFEKITVQQIVKAAGTTTGAFYTRFKDKDALLEAMHARHVADSVVYLEEALAKISGPASYEHVAIIVGMIGAVFRLRPALMRSGTLKYWNAPQGTVARQVQSTEHAEFAKQIRSVREKLEGIARAYGNADPEAAAHFALKIALASSRHHYLFSDERTVLKIDDQSFERELAKMVECYLKGGDIGK